MILKNEIALVTGATRGIGKAIARALGEKGATVIGTATSQAGAEAISQDLRDRNINGRGAVLDVASSASVNALMKEIEKEMPGILVNNAAITRDNLLVRMRDEEWESVINTNLNAIFRLTKACLRPMMKARHGRIISITSLVGLTGNPGQANYAAAKAGLIGFSKSLAREAGSRNITVNTVAPGFIDTDMTRDMPEQQRSAVLQQIPLKRAGSPEDVAEAVAFLASPAAAYITGETLHINGGIYMV
ncbi:MAG: 3-oxoacyl-ACP reductase FabG [Gammaproteobacteria bacterium]|nr:3-oxoacyl-ACP reductase FabG [Gammaproteobacteria bacterium]